MIRDALVGCLFAAGALACSHADSSGARRDGAGGNEDGGRQASLAGAPGGGATSGDTSQSGTTSAGTAATSGAPQLGGNAGASAGAPNTTSAGGGRGSAANAGAGTNGGATHSGASGAGGTLGGAPSNGGSGDLEPGDPSGWVQPVPVKNLPVINDMPDPLTMNDGTKVTTPEQWRARRQEMIALLETYEYGHMPPPPGNVTATTTTAPSTVSAGSNLQAEYRLLHLTFGPNQTLGFDLGIFTPVGGATGQTYPVLVSLTTSANAQSIGSASAALARGYAVATVPYQDLGADATNWQSTGFFPAYPDYDWRDISGWAWGISRAIDYLVTDPAVAPDKIMITGVSRLGQAVLLAGAFDERIALSAPVAAGAAFRFSGKEMGGGLGQGITEVEDQNTYWFGPLLPEFKNQTPRLPSDQHWLPALTAPRLFIMCNSLQDQYGRAYAAVQTYEYAKPVYQFLLGSDQNIGVNFREGTHGMTSDDWSALLDFADQYLLMKGGARTFDQLPPADELP
jgi:hypothetical protein